MAKRSSRRKLLAIGGGLLAVATAGVLATQDPGDRASVAMLRAPTVASGEGSGGLTAVDAAMASDAEAKRSDAFGTAATGAAAPPNGGLSVENVALPAGVGATSVVRTASLEVEIGDGDFQAAFAKVPLIASAAGGFVASSTSTSAADGDGRGGGGSLVVRVPAERFDAVRLELARLGDLRSEQLQGTDVGAQLTDLDARLRNLRSQEEALRLLMTKTTNVGETIEVQRQLSGVREQVERLSAEQARVQDAVAMSTITVSLFEPGASLRTDDGGSSLADAFGQAFDGAERVVAAAIVAVGYLLPLAVLAALAWLIARPFLRARRPSEEPAPVAP